MHCCILPHNTALFTTQAQVNCLQCSNMEDNAVRMNMHRLLLPLRAFGLCLDSRKPERDALPLGHPAVMYIVSVLSTVTCRRGR